MWVNNWQFNPFGIFLNEEHILPISWGSGVKLVSTIIAISFLFISFESPFDHPLTLTFGLIPLRPTYYANFEKSCWEMWFCNLSLYTCVNMCACNPAFTYTCVYILKKKNAVCPGVLSGRPRDTLVITSVSLSGLNYKASGKTPLLPPPCQCICVLVSQYVPLLQGSPPI